MPRGDSYLWVHLVRPKDAFLRINPSGKTIEEKGSLRVKVELSLDEGKSVQMRIISSPGARPHLKRKNMEEKKTGGRREALFVGPDCPQS